MKETNQIPLEKPSSIREEDEQKIAMYAKELESSNLVEDIKFREIAKSKEAIQEILRVILDEDELIVLESIEQKSPRPCVPTTRSGIAPTTRLSS